MKATNTAGLLLGTVLLMPAMAFAAMTCSIHPGKGVADSALPGLAKITLADAKAVALGPYAAGQAKISEGELESENGCLIYSFDIRRQDKSGIDEVMVDAGTGKLLSRSHETPRQEAAEAAADRAAAGKH